VDLERSAEQREIADAVRRFASERIDAARLRAWESEARGLDEATWREIAELGWFGVGVPAESGGAGLGFEEIATWFEEGARGLLPPAVVHAVRANRCLALLDPAAPEIEPLCRGKELLALSVPAFPARQTEGLRLEGQGSQLRLSGEARFVSNGSVASLHLLLAWRGEQPAFVLVPTASAERQPLQTFDGDRQAHLRYDRVVVEREVCSGEVAARLWERAWAEQRALAFAELAGIMMEVLDRTVAYVKEREQFGQKIGAFQAVQHQVADMAILCTAGRHLAWQAITRLANGTLQGCEFAAAAAFLGPAARRVTLTAHHLHGGAGYVLEHPLHYYSERAVSLSLRYCAQEQARAAVAAWWLDGEFPPL